MSILIRQQQQHQHRIIPALKQVPQSIQIAAVRAMYQIYEIEIEGVVLAYPIDPETGLIRNFAFDLTAIQSKH